ncbi:MAG: hypothetical protein NTX17_04345 [Candidatus Eisenbacteria bacterium]|nr:hypothetical protein [Candidatus Eisenbacteria bacterium]
MKLKVLPFALAAGIVSGVACFLTTLFVHAQGGGGHMYLMHRMWPGYCVSVGGAFLGLVYGFVYGFAIAGVLVWLYNAMAGTK